MHWVRQLGVMAVAMTIAACSGGRAPPPSGAEVQRAVRTLMLSDYAKFHRPGAKRDGGITVTRVQDLGCAAAPDDRGYLCQTVIDTVTPAQGKQEIMRLVRMVRGGTGWRAVME